MNLFFSSLFFFIFAGEVFIAFRFLIWRQNFTLTLIQAAYGNDSEFGLVFRLSSNTRSENK